MSTRPFVRRTGRVLTEPYLAGYKDATRACESGAIESAWLDLGRPRHRGTGYLVGFRTAVWDYERAHGLSPSKPPPFAYGNGVLPRQPHRGPATSP